MFTHIQINDADDSNLRVIIPFTQGLIVAERRDHTAVLSMSNDPKGPSTKAPSYDTIKDIMMAAGMVLDSAIPVAVLQKTEASEALKRQLRAADDELIAVRAGFGQLSSRMEDLKGEVSQIVAMVSTEEMEAILGEATPIAERVAKLITLWESQREQLQIKLKDERANKAAMAEAVGNISKMAGLLHDLYHDKPGAKQAAREALGLAL